MWNFHDVITAGFMRIDQTWGKARSFYKKGMKQSVKNYINACYIILYLEKEYAKEKIGNRMESKIVGVRYERITTYMYIDGTLIWPFPVSDLKTDVV